MNQAFGKASSRTKSLVSEGYGAWPALLTHTACLIHSSPHQASRFQEKQGQRAKAGIRKMLPRILSSLAKDLVRGGSNYNPFTRLQNPFRAESAFCMAERVPQSRAWTRGVLSNCLWTRFYSTCLVSSELHRSGKYRGHSYIEESHSAVKKALSRRPFGPLLRVLLFRL